MLEEKLKLLCVTAAWYKRNAKAKSCNFTSFLIAVTSACYWCLELCEYIVCVCVCVWGQMFSDVYICSCTAGELLAEVRLER